MSEQTVPVYTSSNGRSTPIDKMPDTHLVNAIRKMEKACLGAGHVPGADFPLYPALLAELKRRPQQTQDWYLERRSKGQ